MRRAKILLSVAGIIVTLALTMLAGSAAMTARHPSFNPGVDPESAGSRWHFATLEAKGRRW